MAGFRYHRHMSGEWTGRDADTQVGLDALWQGLFFTGLGVAWPWLVSAGKALLQRSLVALWVTLPQSAEASASTLWPLLRPACMGLLQGVAGLVLLALVSLGIVWRVQQSRGRSVQPAQGLSAPVLGAIVWGTGLALLLPRWLSLYTWPEETYGLAVLDGLRALLLLAGIVHLLRAGLALWKPR